MNRSPMDPAFCIQCGKVFLHRDSCIVATNQATESPVEAGTVMQEPPVVRVPRRPRRRWFRKLPEPRLPDVRHVWYTNPADPENGPPIQGTQILAELACPQCRRPVSDEYLIALIGDTASGKSTYIASFVQHILDTRTLAGYRCSVQARGDSYERYTEHYYQPLVRRREKLLPNQPVRDARNAPLSFTIVLDRPAGGPRHELSFAVFDLAGEVLTDTGRRVLAAQYVNQASAIMFFVDPMALPGFVRHLPPDLRNGSGAAGMHSRIGHTIGSVVDTYNGFHARGGTTPLPIPVSITMSKSDLAVYPCKELSREPSFLADDRHIEGYDIRRAREVSREVRDFLEMVQGDDALSREGLLHNVMYHAVSATGKEDADGRYADYRPIRCLDPFLWILSQWGIVDDG